MGQGRRHEVLMRGDGFIGMGGDAFGGTRGDAFPAFEKSAEDAPRKL